MSDILDRIGYAMSLRIPQKEALGYLDAISSNCNYQKDNIKDILQVATENCEGKHKIEVDKNFNFPSFCFNMATGIGKTRLMGAAIYYLYKTKGYKHFFILAPGNTIYDKLRKESNPAHPKYIFKGLEAEMGRPKVYYGENYTSYPVRYIQGEIEIEKTSEIELFIFNIGKIFNSKTDTTFRFHKYQETLGASFADVLASFDDLVICMDESHRYYAPVSMQAISYLKPILGLEFTATPKNCKNVIYSYGLEKGAGKYLKIPVVMGRTNMGGYSPEDVEEMKIRDGLALHENRKNVVRQYCNEHLELNPVKPIVLIACKDTEHAKKVRALIDNENFNNGKYRGKVIEIHSNMKGDESEENICKLLSIERTDNPIEIVLHVYKLKEGWDVNNLFTIIPLNAAKSDILALQTIGRGLRLPFGFITGNEEIDTLDIVAHEHYREIIDDIKSNPVFKYRNLDERATENTKTVEIKSVVNNEQLTFIDDLFTLAGVTSFAQVDNIKTQRELLEAYDRTFGDRKKEKAVSTTNHQLSMFDEPENEEGVNPISGNEIPATVEKPTNQSIKREELINKIKTYTAKAISIPKIVVQPSTLLKLKPFTVKRNIVDFEVAASKIERYDIVNQQMLAVVDAQILEVDDPFNTLACMLFDNDSLSEIDPAEDADYIIDIVNQYLTLIDGTNEDKKKIVRRYGKIIVDDIIKQIHDNMDKQVSYVYNIQKDLIMFGNQERRVKSDGGEQNFRKAFADKINISKYIFTGYTKSYYSDNCFDSDTERLFSIILEDDESVIKWVKPPLNRLGIYWKPGRQYTPDFIVETNEGKYMVEVKAKNEAYNDEVQLKALEAIKWCKYASDVDKEGMKWKYCLITDNNIQVGNTCKYTLGLAVKMEEE